MMLKGGTSHACAACKYQRRKCSSDCQLAPFFPSNRPETFRNAHKLFGVRNIVKILEKLDHHQRQEAMQSIIWQSNIRDIYPVRGCLDYIYALQYKIRQAEEELHSVHSQLQIYRHQHHPFPDDMVPSSQLQLGMAPPEQVVDLQHSYCMSTNNNNSGYLDNKDDVVGNSFWLHHNYGINNDDEVINSSNMGIQQEVVHDYPFFDTIDDSQSYIGDSTKEAYDTSSEESIKDTTQSLEQVAENELKSAAACFSLTSLDFKELGNSRSHHLMRSWSFA
ncbi:LOB domain-containing protein 27 [Linum grandiflorum]